MSWRDVADEVLDATQVAFGDSVVYTPPGGEPVTLENAPFRAAHQGIDTESGADVLVQRPELAVKLAELPGGDWVADAQVDLPDGKVYRVESGEPDGEGAAVLHLHEVAP